MYSMDSESLYSYPASRYEPAADLRLSPSSHDVDQVSNNYLPPPPRVAFGGSLDPTTGIFYHMPENPRIRTALACDKCRTRKAKCSGEHPSCARCVSRGLICEYSKENKVRAPQRILLGGRPRAQSSAMAMRPCHSQSPSNSEGGSSKKRRRNTTLSLGAPLSSRVPLPLVFPAHLRSSTFNKRLSLPALLDVNDVDVIPMNSGYDTRNGYDRSENSSRRSSAAYARDSPLDCFEPQRNYLDDANLPPLESGYALGHPVTLHALEWSPDAHPAPPLGVGMELHLAQRGHGRRTGSGSSSSASGSSFDGESPSTGPDSAVEGGFPLFREAHSHSHFPHSPHGEYGSSISPTAGWAHADFRPSSAHPQFAIHGHGQHGVKHEYAGSEPRVYDAAGRYIGADDPTCVLQYPPEQQPKPSLPFPSLAYPTWGYEPSGPSHPRAKLPLGATLRGWVEPPSMPLALAPVRHMEVAMPVPSRGVSGLSVVIPLTKRKSECASALSLFSAGGSVPPSAVSTSASEASSPLSSALSTREDVGGFERGARGVGPARPIPRSASSGELGTFVALSAAGENSAVGRMRGQTVSGALGGV